MCDDKASRQRPVRHLRRSVLDLEDLNLGMKRVPEGEIEA